MSDWRFFSEVSGSDGSTKIETEHGNDSRIRVTFTKDGDKKVVHTFDMSKRWQKRFGEAESR